MQSPELPASAQASVAGTFVEQATRKTAAIKDRMHPQ
jgi:hypothetical protein